MSSPPPSPIPSSFFGLTVLNFENLNPPLAFGTTRTWDSWPNLDWSDVNPANGTYRFEWLDQFLKKFSDKDILYTFGRTPRWASSLPDQPTPYGPGQCAPPSDIKYWDDYITALLNHTQGKIKYFEIWNEPDDPDFFCGNISQMVVLAQHAHQIIKTMQPDAKILSPAVTDSAGPQWANSFLSWGGSQYVDIIAFHGYWDDTAESIVGVVPMYQALMEKNGLGSLPLWDTEASWAGDNGDPPTPQDKGAFLAKYYLLQWSLGVERFIWYAYDGGFWGGLYNSTTGMLPQGTAYNWVYNWMSNATMLEPCSKATNNIWTCNLFRSQGYQAQAVWNSVASTEYDVPSIFTQYRDLYGNVSRITQPIYATNSPLLLENFFGSE